MAKIDKRKMPEIHIDIGSHNENPRRRVRYVKRTMKMHDGEFIFAGQPVEIIEIKGERFHVRTDEGLTYWLYKEDLSARKIMNNPRPRVGTARPTRASSITHKKPSKRLVARRKANSKPGYFPNPVDSALTNNFRVYIYGAIEDVTRSRPGIARATMLNKQARVSYAQGLIQAGHMLKILDKDETADFMRLLKQSWEGQK